MQSPAVPPELLADLLGAKKNKQIEFVGQLVEALEQVSPNLVPRLDDHPYADAIIEGPSACSTLLRLYHSEKDELAKAAILDAITRINHQDFPTQEVLTSLEKILSECKSEILVSAAATALASARHESFLEQQKAFLASDSPSQVRISAKLLGYGRYEPATAALLTLLQPDNMAVADSVIWALGEIGHESALPTLHEMLTASVMSEEVLDAMGKIGNLTSVVRVIAILLEGTIQQREKAAQAFSRIARNNDGQLDDDELQARSLGLLESLIEKDKSILVRFHCIVTHSILGGHLTSGQIMKALGARVSPSRLDSVAGFFANRGSKV
ncbi:MAG: HEAT repeat domain-containing protein [Myxococcota bacterium]|nr:HEAT repeat domain-containing protein [Myxococcota bacterium]